MQLRILCVHSETSSFWAEFVNKNRCISVRLVSEPPRRLKALNFDNFDNSHNSFLWPEYVIDFFMWKMDPMSGFDTRFVFTLPPKDSTLQYKRCVHFWNNFSCTCVSFGVVQKPVTLSTGKFKWRKRNQKLKLNHVQPLNLVITLLDCQKIFNGKNYDNKKNNFKGVTDSVW